MGIFLRKQLERWNILHPRHQPPHARMSADGRGVSGITKPSVLLGGGAPPPGWRAEVPGPFPTPRSHPFSAPHRWLWCRGAMAFRPCRGPRFPPLEAHRREYPTATHPRSCPRRQRTTDRVPGKEHALLPTIHRQCCGLCHPPKGPH